MTALGKHLRDALPDRQEVALAGCLWLKAMLFFLLVFKADQMNFSMAPMRQEIFRSLLRPLYFFLIPLLALAPLQGLPSRWRLRTYKIFNLLYTALLLVDLWNYRAFRVFPSLLVLQGAGHLAFTPGMVLTLVHGYDLLLFLDFVLLVPIARLRAAHPRPALARLALRLSASVALLALIGPVGGGLLHSRSAAEPLQIHDTFKTTLRLSPLGFHAVDAARVLAGGRITFQDLSGEERGQIAAWLQDQRRALLPSPYHGRMAGKNLLFIQVESLEAFVLDQEVAGAQVTPTLNALKKQGLYFSQFHEQVRSGVSSDADLMTNTSIYPITTGPTFTLFPTATLPSLPRILAQRGYETLSMHPDRGSVWNCLPGLRNLGFGQCQDSSCFDCTDAWGTGLCDGSFLEQVAPRLEARKHPFYAFVVTQSSHLPFEPPEYVRELPLAPELERCVMGGYLQAVHYTDKQLGRFLGELRRRGVLDDTVVAIAGDHQGVHKYCREELHHSALAQPWWEDTTRRIPFLVLAPGLPPMECRAQGGQVDIMPTLLDLLGVDQDPWCRALMGRSLLAPGPDQCVLADGVLTAHGGDPAWDRHCAEGPAIADLIIRGNYFRTGPGSMDRAARVEQRDVDRQ